MPGKDIVDLFDPYRGDLLYGFAGDRDECIKHMMALCPPDSGLHIFFNVDNLKNIWLTVDAYNDAIFGSAGLFAGEREDEQISQRAAAITDPGVKQFWEDLRKHRFSPLEAFDASKEKLLREGWPGISKDRYYLAIRRACKFGIEQVLQAASPDARIHFLLDRFARNHGERMIQAVLKTPTQKGSSPTAERTAVPITYSEIRYIYRNWGRLKDRIIFYYEFKQADYAPWEDDSKKAKSQCDIGGGEETVEMTYRQLWDMYAQDRNAKYLDKKWANKVKTAKSLRATIYMQNSSKVNKLVGEAEALSNVEIDEKVKKYEEALLVLEPDRGKWKIFETTL